MSIIAVFGQLFPNSNFFAIFLLFFLYALSIVSDTKFFKNFPPVLCSFFVSSAMRNTFILLVQLYQGLFSNLQQILKTCLIEIQCFLLVLYNL